MKPDQFIEYYRQGFGERAELPLVFWYSNEALALPIKHKGCYIGALKTAREGEILSSNSEYISCPGGKLWAGFSSPNPNLPNFISAVERYKKNKNLVEEFISPFSIPEKAEKWINFARIDKIDSFKGKEGVIFFATPDILSGLISWCLFDTNTPDAVSILFGSGCGSIITQVVSENKNKGKRTFLGMIDPSARPNVEKDILTYAVPIDRFVEMCSSITETFLIKSTKDWQRIKERIDHE